MQEKVVRLAVDMTVHEGQREAFRALAKEMTRKSETETGTLGYEWFFSDDGRRGRLLETYADAGAVWAHFAGPVVSELVPQLVALCQIDRVEVYGDPGPQARSMATALGAQIFAYWTGLSR
jgi:quinol monooxygenase YgiN